MNKKQRSGSEEIVNQSAHNVGTHTPLHELNLRLQNIVESIDVPIYLTDSNGYILLFNQEAAKLWGRTPEIGTDRWTGAIKLLQVDGSEFQPGENPMARALNQKFDDPHAEVIVVRPDGTQRTVVTSPKPLFDEKGTVIGGVNLLLDITNAKALEKKTRTNEIEAGELATYLEKIIQNQTMDLVLKIEELRKSEERYHKMIEEVEDYAIILLDKDGIIRNWNKGAEKIKGYSDQEILGKSFELFYLEEDRQAGLPKTLIERARNEGKAIHEGWRRRKDGTAFWGSIVLTALHNEKNEVIGFSKVTRDLTERKIAEDKLKDYTYELEFQNKELEQFAYAASHDMMEPLRKIHFYNNYVLENGADQLDEKSREYLSRSMNAVKRMSNLIDDLLTYSRTTLNAETFEEVDLNEIVEELVLNNKEDFEQKNITVNISDLPVIQLVPFQIKQLMDNLFNNAIKYKHPERDLVIDVKSEIISGSQVRENDVDTFRKRFYKVSVIDNGIGFEPQYSEKIFEVFQRLNSSPGTKGSGIGLAICKKIMQNHKGFIKAIGKPDEGARFDVYFPVTAPSD